MNKQILIVGGGVSGAYASTKLVDNGYPGKYITIVDKGKDPYKRQSDEVMEGWLGSGLFSDGKIVMSTTQGGQLSKYCGEEKAMELMEEGMAMLRRFHPEPDKIMYSDPHKEPDFIKPYFELRMSPVYHIGTNYLALIGKRWYDYLIEKGVNFVWETEVSDIDFEDKFAIDIHGVIYYYDTLIYGTGKSGMGLTQQLINEYMLPVEGKSAQIGIRYEAPQKYFQKILDVAYDFKLYQSHGNVSIRTFCTNSNAAYVAAERTYGDVSYNGHAMNGEQYRNDMVNFGILMEIKGIENPFEWSRDIVHKCQYISEGRQPNTGIYYSPDRFHSLCADGFPVSCVDLDKDGLQIFLDVFGEYAYYVLSFIADLNKVFEFGEDWGMYFPEVKYASEEVLVSYNDLSLIDYPDVHFVGDALSSRGISSAAGQGLLCAENILKNA